jgi:cell wall-associated NlpC family hydrolase
MRRPVRLKRPIRTTALVAALVASLVAGLAIVVIPSAARAQTSVPAVAPVVNAAPISAVEKSAILARSAASAATARVASVRQAEQAARAAREAKVQKLRARIVTVAKKQVGDRYSAGASGPSAFDCSGLTRYVYKVATGKELPHHSRAQYAKVKRIKRSQAKPGDLVFFFGGGAHHVGVYIGKGRMVDAAGHGKGVRVSPISGSWWSRTYSGMGRLLPA